MIYHNFSFASFLMDKYEWRFPVFKEVSYSYKNPHFKFVWKILNMIWRSSDKGILFRRMS